jgi:adenine/guanine phosphoribosyltransferase-like PRPP-binding protein
VLVPIPRCGPSTSGAAWVAGELAVALQRFGLAAAVWTGLKRKYAIRKSATAPDGERPTVWQHYESLCVEPSLSAADRLVLVDDVVTKGRTLLAAAMRMREAFPGAQLRAFALVRTMGLVPEVRQLLDPCQGEIRWAGEDAQRDP